MGSLILLGHLASGRGLVRLTVPGLRVRQHLLSDVLRVGAGRVLWPLVAGFARQLTAAVGGWLAIHWLGGSLAGLFVAIALSLIVFGTTVAVAIRAGAWQSRASITKTSPEAALREQGL